ncbi:CBASS cGAMP-activated phospholipase [Rhodopseudomonas palustris]|uniref:CBASS cGAMP-activated phospholipase n=1 Tax=Rhodopseudomonas palustris TaxID=1076 RepID=UPI0021F3C4CA|nr:CBASS cGAMP-activated phospholipase [Rhodopseudomonas palustris]UYO55184.1 patatin-like phospholipase family protein [Rhodopseudomonas palustris]
MAFQILALSGGGYRGLFSTAILAKLEAQAGKPLHKCFDLIAGTSIGGIVALGLGLGKSADSIKQMFLDRGEAIFPKGEKPTGRYGKLKARWREWNGPKYDGTELRAAIAEMFETGARLGDAKTRLLISSVNMTKGSVQMFKTAHHPDFLNDHKLSVVDIAMATSAAPLFFPMARVENSNFIDGGIVANAPDLCAVHEATTFLGRQTDEISVLSIGTTTSKFSLPNSLGREFGQKHWLENDRLASTVMSSQQQMVQFMMGHLLKDRFVRFDEEPSAEQICDLGMDLASEARRTTLLGMADGCYQKLCNNQQTLRMLKHQAAEPEFFHKN